MWVKIRCTACGKVIAEAKPGSEVKKKCKCGQVNTITIPTSFANKTPQVIK